MTPEEKAIGLINMYYNHSKSQHEAIIMVEEVLLTGFCQKVDSLHNHVFNTKDFDEALIKSSIQQLKYDQEIAYHVRQIKNKLPILK